jgi:hypothetical protein
MATRLGVYNEALRLLGERQLASLTEDREARRLLDAAWDANAHDSWLEQSDWNFAMRAVKIGNDASYEAQWGPANAYQHPDDMDRPSGVYQDELMKIPLRDYLDEGQYWFSDVSNAIYVQYVSNGASYGGDLGLWPASFAKYVAAFLAVEVAPVLKNDVDVEALTRMFEKREREARSKDGLKSPSKPLPTGNWKASRLVGGRSRAGWDGTSR